MLIFELLCAQVLVVGGRMQVQIDEITDDENIDLLCLEIFKQTSPAKKKASPSSSAKKSKSTAPPQKDDDEDNMYYDADDDDSNQFGYDDEW